MSGYKYTKQSFLQSVRTKYPQYGNVDDNTLYTAMLEKYPVYQNQIEPEIRGSVVSKLLNRFDKPVQPKPQDQEQQVAAQYNNAIEDMIRNNPDQYKTIEQLAGKNRRLDTIESVIGANGKDKFIAQGFALGKAGKLPQEKDATGDFFKNFGISVKRGLENTNLDEKFADAAILGGDYTPLLEESKRLQKIQIDSPIEDKNFFEDMMYGAAGSLGYMSKIAAASGAAALTAGAIAGNVPDPTDIVTVPATMLGVGTATAFTYGARQGAGSSIRAMLEAGVDANIAGPLGLLVGIPYGIAEQSQLLRIPGLKRGINKVIQRKALPVLLNYFKERGIDYILENMEEIVQEISLISGEEFGKLIDNAVNNKDLDYATGKEIRDRLILTAKESAKAFLPIMLAGSASPHGIKRVGAELQTAKAIQKELEETVKTGEEQRHAEERIGLPEKYKEAQEKAPELQKLERKELNKIAFNDFVAEKNIDWGKIRKNKKQTEKLYNDLLNEYETIPEDQAEAQATLPEGALSFNKFIDQLDNITDELLEKTTDEELNDLLVNEYARYLDQYAAQQGEIKAPVKERGVIGTGTLIGQKIPLDVAKQPIIIPGEENLTDLQKLYRLSADLYRQYKDTPSTELEEQLDLVSDQIRELAVEKPNAKFIGMQKDTKGNEIPLFNIIQKGHPREGSTVTAKTLEELGLEVPEYKTKEIQNAERIGAETQEEGEPVTSGLAAEEKERLRVRNIEENRLGARYTKAETKKELIALTEGTEEQYDKAMELFGLPYKMLNDEEIARVNEELTIPESGKPGVQPQKAKIISGEVVSPEPAVKRKLKKPIGEQPIAAVGVGVKPTPGVSKQPWEMTKAEYRATWDTPEFRKKFPNYKGEQDHAALVAEAIDAGKNVPKEVLDEYPSLAKPEVKGKVPVTEKQPWQMTRDEFVDFDKIDWSKTGRLKAANGTLIIKYPKYGDIISGGDWSKKYAAYDLHEKLISKALSEGKNIPAEVLKDYPDLAKPITKTGKQPWEMTKAEIEEKYAFTGLVFDHKTSIQQALSEGKTPYKGWQHDYPELARTLAAEKPKRKLKKPVKTDLIEGRTLSEVKTDMLDMFEKFNEGRSYQGGYVKHIWAGEANIDYEGIKRRELDPSGFFQHYMAQHGKKQVRDTINNIRTGKGLTELQVQIWEHIQGRHDEMIEEGKGRYIAEIEKLKTIDEADKYYTGNKDIWTTSPEFDELKSILNDKYRILIQEAQEAFNDEQAERIAIQEADIDTKTEANWEFNVSAIEAEEKSLSADQGKGGGLEPKVQTPVKPEPLTDQLNNLTSERDNLNRQIDKIATKIKDLSQEGLFGATAADQVTLFGDSRPELEKQQAKVIEKRNNIEAQIDKLTAKQEGIEAVEKGKDTIDLFEKSTEHDLISRDRIRPKKQGIGKNRFWEYRDKDGRYTVAPNKNEAIKRATEAEIQTSVAISETAPQFSQATFTHSKTGEKVYVVKLGNTVDPKLFMKLKSSAKASGGYWSRYKNEGAIAGFLFKSQASANEFIGKNSGKVVEQKKPTGIPEKDVVKIEYLEEPKEKSGFGKGLTDVNITGEIYHSTTVDGFSVLMGLRDGEVISFTTPESNRLIDKGYDGVVVIFKSEKRNGVYTPYDADSGKNFGYDEFRTDLKKGTIKSIVVTDKMYDFMNLLKEIPNNELPELYSNLPFDDAQLDNILMLYWDYNVIPIRKTGKIKSFYNIDDSNQLNNATRILIEKALSEGKPVPAEVLKDYPDLAPKVEKVSQKGSEYDKVIARTNKIWVNATDKLFDTKLAATSWANSNVKNQDHIIEKVEVAPGQKRFRVGIEQEINPERFMRGEIILYNKEGKIETSTAPHYVQEDIYYIFKDKPNDRYISLSTMNIPFFVHIEHGSTKDAISKDIYAIRDKYNKDEALKSAARLKSGGLLQTMADNQLEEAEVVEVTQNTDDIISKLSGPQKEQLIAHYLGGEFEVKPGSSTVVKSIIKLGMTDESGLNEAGKRVAKILADQSHEKISGKPIITDPAEVQKLKNSIAEGEQILKSGKKDNGEPYSVEGLETVRQSVINSKERIGDTSATPEIQPKKVLKKPEKRVLRKPGEEPKVSEPKTKYQLKILGISLEEAKESISNRGIKGDDLLNAEDRIDEVLSNDKTAEIDNKGFITLYHRTTPENAEMIVKSGVMKKRETALFFGTKPEGQIEGYGEAVIKVTVPIEKTEINDIFKDEVHLTIPGKNLKDVKIKADIWNKAQVPTSLEAEARKYKTAEAFVESKSSGWLFAETNKPFTAKAFHGSPDARFAEEFDPQKKGYYPQLPEALPYNVGFEELHGGIRQGFRNESITGNIGISFSKSQQVARSYANKPAFDYQNSIPMVLERYITLNNPKVVDFHGGGWNLKMQEEIDSAIKEGHDGLIFKNIKDDYHIPDSKITTDNVIVFDKKNIKTKTQLTDIWNKAHAKVSEPTVKYETKIDIDKVEFDSQIKDEHKKAYGSEEKYDKAIDNAVKETDKAKSLSDKPYEITREVGIRPRPKTTLRQTPAKTFRRLKYIDLRGTQISSSRDVAEVFQIFRNPEIEHFHTVLTDKDNNIISHSVISSGQPNQVVVTRKVLLNAILRAKRVNASNIWFLHNHPSGKVLPSRGDLSLTGIISVLIEENAPELNFKGHIIINHDKYTRLDVSKSDLKQMITNKVGNVDAYEDMSYTPTTEMVVDLGKPITETAHVVNLFNSTLKPAFKGNKVAIIILDNNNRIKTIEFVNKKKTIEELNSPIYQLLRANNGVSAILAGNDLSLGENEKVISPVLDVIMYNTETNKFDSLGRREVPYTNIVTIGGKEINIAEPTAYGVFEGQPKFQRIDKEIARLESQLPTAGLGPIEHHHVATLIKRKIKAITKGNKIGGLDMSEQIKTVQGEIRKYARKNLPKHEITRGQVTQLMNKVEKAKTIEDVQDAFEKIESIFNAVSDKITRVKIVKLLKRYHPQKIGGKTVGTTLMPTEYQKLKEIEDLLNSDRIISYQELQAIKTAMENNGVSDIDIDELKKKLVLTEGLKNKTGAELQEILSEIQSIVEEGRTKRKVIEEQRKTINEAIRNQVIDDVTGGKGIASQEQIIAEGKEKDKNFINKFISTNLSLEHLLDKIDNNKEYGMLQGFMSRRYGIMVHEARNAETTGEAFYFDMCQDKLEEIFDATKFKLERRLQKNKEKVDTGIDVIKKDGTKVRLHLSQNTAYKIWQWYQDPSLQSTFDNMGYSNEAMDGIEAFLTPETKQWAMWQLDEFYPQYYESINQPFRDRYFIDLPFNPFYSPLKREGKTSETEDEQLMQVKNVVASVLNASLKSRVENKSALDITSDGDVVLSRHITQMEHFKAWVKPINEMRSIFGHEDVRRAIIQQHGRTAYQVLDKMINDLARGGIDHAMQVQFIDKIRGRFIKAVVASPVVMVKQLTSIPAYAMDMPAGSFVAGVADFFNPLKRTSAIKILAESEMMKARYRIGWERDIITALRKSVPKRMAGAVKLSDYLVLMTKTGDKAAILVGGWAVYRYHYNKVIEAGQSIEQAKKTAMLEFELTTKRTQQAGDVQDLGQIQRGGSFAKLFTMFITAPNSYFRQEIGAIRNLAKGRGNKADLLKRIVIAHFVLPMLFQFVASGLKWDREKQIRAMLLGAFNGILVAGDMLELFFTVMVNAISKRLNKKRLKKGTPLYEGEVFPRYQELNVPLYDIPNMLIRGVGKIVEKGEFDDLQSVLETMEVLAEPTGQLFGVPYGTGKRMYKGTKATIEGETKYPVRRIMGWSEYAMGEQKKKKRKLKKPGPPLPAPRWSPP